MRRTTERGRRLLAPAAVVLVVAGGVLLAGCDLLPKRSPGETLWRQRCSECHGLDASGNTPRYMGDYKADLRDDTWSHGSDPGSWAVVIKDGVFGSMPANPDLSREQINALVQYLRQLRGEAVPRAGG